MFMRQVLPELLDDMPLCIRRQMWFQQDGAPAHTSWKVRQYLDHTIPDRWKGLSAPVLWPARSSNLTPLNFYLWAHTKRIIQETPVESEMDLVGRIVDAAALIADNPRVFFYRVQECFALVPDLH